MPMDDPNITNDPALRAENLSRVERDAVVLHGLPPNLFCIYTVYIHIRYSNK